MHVDLSLVVLRAPRIHAAVAHVGLERRRRPQLLRIRRLHVVVSVNENGGTLNVRPMLGVDHRVAVRLDDLDRFQAGVRQVACQPLRTAEDITGEAAVGADARYPEQLRQLLLETVAILAQISVDLGHS